MAPPETPPTVEASIEDVLDEFAAGRAVVVIAETFDGTAAVLLGALPSGMTPDVVTAGEATRGRSGCIAEELGPEGLEGRVVVLEQAQWADPTSLGRLQRQIKSAEAAFLLMVAWRAGSDEWGIHRLAETARSRARLHEVRIDEATEREPLTDAAARDLVLASSLLAESLSVEVAARLLDQEESVVLALAESLVASGHLRQTRRGFHANVPPSSLRTGEARMGYMAGRLASVLEETGADSAVVGGLLEVAGEPGAAYPHLAEAAGTAAANGESGEAYHLSLAALRSADEGGVQEADRGLLHLIAGRHLRLAGRSEDAASHLDRAVAELAGTERIDALGFAAAVADDRQRPQEAERILALAEWEAARQGQIAKLGSLSSFRARAINRLGFAVEADAVMEKAKALLADASPVQRFNAENNQAWMAFDRGMMREADTHFTHLRDRTEPDDRAGRADKEAWRARVLFATGRPDEALAAVDDARRLAGDGEVEAPLFLADLALAEGNLGFGRYEEALTAIDRVLDLVERQLPAWENVARANRASVLARMDRLDEARREVESALAATPAGADGWRWRCRIQAVALEIEGRSGREWGRRQAEDLADQLIQARLIGWAADLMCFMAYQDGNAELAEEAMALALHAGQPLVAARACEAANLWRRPEAAPCIRAVRAVEAHVPVEWLEEWRRRPEVAAALEAPAPRDDESAGQSLELVQRAVRRAGLDDEQWALSPAQRRSRGLVPRRARRRQGPWRAAAATAGVAAVAALTALGVAQLGEEPSPVTVVREVAAPDATTGVETTLEDTLIPLPEGVEFLFGIAQFRGGNGRAGVFEATGAPQVDGHYWTYETAGPIVATPVAYGRNLLVPSTDGTLYALDQSTGEVAWTLQSDDRLTASPAVAMVEGFEGDQPALAVVGGDDGVVRSRHAVTEVTAENWSVSVGTRISSSPAVGDDGSVFVATMDGFVHALDLLTGEERWRFPAGEEGLGPISAPLAYEGGVVYAATREGSLHLIEADTGEERCEFSSGAAVVAAPVVTEGAMFLPTRGNTVFVKPAGACEGSVPDRLPLYGTETAVEVPPAVVGDTMYLPAGQFLYSIDLRTNEHQWSPSTVDAGEVITGAPVVADGTVYFGTRSGTVRAVDAESGESRWEWQTGNFVRASPVVVDGAVFVASGDGKVYALGPR